MVAARFPVTFATISGQLRRAQAETGPWWQREVARSAGLSLDEAVRQLADGADRFSANVRLQGIHVMCAIQPVYDALVKVVGKAGVGEVTSFMGGYGSHAETLVVADLWKAARGELSLEEVVRRHGYHGPREGEVSGLVWREDDTPLRGLLRAYRDLDDEQSPLVLEERLRRERLELERELLAATGPAGRMGAKLVLRLGAAIIPLRGVGKASFLQSIDVTRAAARRIGALLAEEGVLDDQEDVFFLTRDEIVGGIPEEARDLVARRREAFSRYHGLDLPTHWQGPAVPVPARASDDDGADTDGRPTQVRGVGVSPGIVEGEICVVDDPALADVEPGQILVAPTTDPSWAPLMFVSRALVVDIGGPISHAAVVARELGIPCVVNTKVGSRVLKTGDWCRVDGATGTVDVLRPAPTAD
jgi:pyruvate,water dikinase